MRTFIRKISLLGLAVMLLAALLLSTAFAAETDTEALSETIASGLLERSENIDISAFDISDTSVLSKAVSLALENHPEILWVGSSYSYSSYSKTLIPSYTMDASQISEIKAAIEREYKNITSAITADMTDEEKILCVNDYMCLHYEYDTTLKAEHTHDLLGVMLNKTGVCDSYSKAFLFVMRRLGIECKRAISDSMNHAWNYVKIGDEWYHVDVTWNDPIKDKMGRAGHDHLLLSDDAISQMPNPHYGWDDIGITCSSEKYASAAWRDTSRNVVFDAENMYMITESGKIKAVSRADGSETVIHTISEKWSVVGGPGFWVGCYSNLFFFEERLYFNTPTAVYSMKSDGSDLKLVKDISPSGGYVYGMYIDDNVVKYGVGETPNNKISVTDSFELEKTATKPADPVTPVDPADPEPGTTVIYGDVTGDGKVNSADAVRLAQYLAEWGVSIGTKEADVTGDGKINSADAVRLAQYLAEWGVTLGPAA